MIWTFRSGGLDRSEKHAAIDAWWTAFAARTGDVEALFRREQEWDLAEWMHDHLQAIDERLMWEYGPGPKGGHRLVITPESERYLRPLVSTILERAPRIPGWEFHAFRLPEGPEDAAEMLEARGLRSLANATALVSDAPHNFVDLTFHASDFEGEDDRDAFEAAFVATEVLLGEHTLDTWIGAISVEKSRGPVPGAVPLPGLREAVEERIARIRAGLPQQPAAERAEDAGWTMWQLEPQKQDDYARQDDLFVGKSMLPDMWKAAHSGAEFDSERFSRHGELFCFLKVDGSVALDDEGFADKAEIEDALEAALGASGGGAVVGGGTGLRYSYVDLALTDPQAGIRRVVETLRRGKLTKRAWILFFDDVYAHEWVGVWDDSPPPPGLDAD